MELNSIHFHSNFFKADKMIPRILFLCLFLFIQTENVNSIAVMSVDVGTEWMKIAIVSPGVPMEIALNKESKRKTPMTIAFRDGERTFGEDAVGIGVRFPKNSYSYLLDLLGKTVDNPIVQKFKERFPYYDIIPDPERNTVLFQHDSETVYSPEELLAMILNKAKEFAQESAGQPIKEAVLTVPGYFNQAERKAMLQVADLAGLRVLQLINDYTAVALNYGIFRRKDFNETAQYIMFYDMGASSTTATLVSYQMVKTKDKGYVESNPQLSILGVGYDRTLGGLEIQLRLRDHLGKNFNEQKKTKNDVFKSPRALAKLFKEAGRLKNVLSANAEHYAQVEGLLDEQDFKLLVTREDLEGLCTDLFEKVNYPIEKALKAAGLSMDLVSQFILVGAGTRMPKIQEKLSSFVGMDLGKNLNTDESAALGAVYKAADLSTGFKVKKFITKDAVLFPLQVVFERELEGSSNTKQVKRILFGHMNPYPQKKILTFNKHIDDFSFQVNYSELDHLSEDDIKAIGSLALNKVDLKGVADAVAKHKDENKESKGVKAHFLMDESGILNLINVELIVEKTLTEEELNENEESPLSKLGSTFSKLFTGSEEKKEDIKPVREEPEANEKKEEEKKEKSSSEESKQPDDLKEGNKIDEGNTTNTTTTKQEKKSKLVTIKEPIASTVILIADINLQEKGFEESFKKIKSLNEDDLMRTRKESAQNALESFIFDAQTNLDTEEYKSAATDAESSAIKEACVTAGEWLEDAGPEVEAEVYENRLAEIRKLTGPVWSRVFEHRGRPEAVAGLTSMIEGSKRYLAVYRNLTETAPESPFTAVELETLEKAILEVENWKDKMEKEQETLSLSEDPKLSIKSIHEKMANLDREVKYLVNKSKIWKPKKPKEKKTSEKNETVPETEQKGEDATNQQETENQPELTEPVESETQENVEIPEIQEEPENLKAPETSTDEEKDIHNEL